MEITAFSFRTKKYEPYTFIFCKFGDNIQIIINKKTIVIKFDSMKDIKYIYDMYNTSKLLTLEQKKENNKYVLIGYIIKYNYDITLDSKILYKFKNNPDNWILSKIKLTNNVFKYMQIMDYIKIIYNKSLFYNENIFETVLSNIILNSDIELKKIENQINNNYYDINTFLILLLRIPSDIIIYILNMR